MRPAKQCTAMPCNAEGGLQIQDDIRFPTIFLGRGRGGLIYQTVETDLQSSFFRCHCLFVCLLVIDHNDYNRDHHHDEVE